MIIRVTLVTFPFKTEKKMIFFGQKRIRQQPHGSCNHYIICYEANGIYKIKSHNTLKINILEDIYIYKVIESHKKSKKVI